LFLHAGGSHPQSLQILNQKINSQLPNMTEQSSRSYTIFEISIESRRKVKHRIDDDSKAVQISMLNLVNLAGLESVKHIGANSK